MCFHKLDHQVLLSRKRILFSKIIDCNQLKLSRLSHDDVDSIIRFCYILGEPLWGKNSYLFSK